MRLSRFLYRAAQLSRDVESVKRTAKTGNPRYVMQRAKNKIVGLASSLLRWLCR